MTAASIVLSLVEYTEDDETKKALTKLLFDPLLINYTGKVGDYLKEQADHENDSIGKACEESLAALDRYLGELSTDEIPELHPSQSQQEDYHRHHSRQMSDLEKQAEAESEFLSRINKYVLLYGRKLIHYGHGVDGKASRRETPLHSHSRPFDVARLSILAPFDLDYMLFVFRAERIKP